MKWNKILLGIGIFLIILGAAGIIYDQVSYIRHEKILDIGPLEATIEKDAKCIRLPVIFGILVIISGALIVFFEIKNRYKQRP